MKKVALQDSTLLEILESMYPDSSGRTLKNFFKARRVHLNGAIAAHGNVLIKTGDVITVGQTPPPIFKEFPLLFEDEHLVIIDKPVHLLSVPLDDEISRSALSILQDHYREQFFAVHRIDRETSGALVFAKTLEAKKGMDELFKAHDLIREYLAIVEGHVKPYKGTWQSYLKEKAHFEVCSTDDPEEGQLAITHYEVIKKAPKCTWLRLVLETGKKHQIRVHCRDAGHPVLGDKVYKGALNPYKRLCLQAARIAFKHPITGAPIDVRAQSAPWMASLPSSQDDRRDDNPYQRVSDVDES
jgi:23S rRNA pseudouridine1911/1915/1917 synthase